MPELGPPCLECGKKKTLVVQPEKDALCFTPRCKLERCRSCHGYLTTFVQKFVKDARICQCRPGTGGGTFTDMFNSIMGGGWTR